MADGLCGGLGETALPDVGFGMLGFGLMGSGLVGSGLVGFGMLGALFGNQLYDWRANHAAFI